MLELIINRFYKVLKIVNYNSQHLPIMKVKEILGRETFTFEAVISTLGLYNDFIRDLKIFHKTSLSLNTSLR